MRNAVAFLLLAALAEVSAEGGKDGSMTREETEEFLRQFYSERYLSMIFDDAK